MKAHRKRRLYFIFAIVLGAGLAASFAIYALGQNINLYFTPSQLVAGQAPKNHLFRVGGMVKEGSVQRSNGLNVRFILTDYKKDVVIKYNGILPALFREGQGIVVQGQFNQMGIFIADQVLAKHDEKYMPPGMELTKKNTYKNEPTP